MDRVWIISEELYARREQLPPNRLAEVVCVTSGAQLQREVDASERPMVLAPVQLQDQLAAALPNALAIELLRRDPSPERLQLALRGLLNEAMLRHDLEAAESVAWH